MLQQLSHALVNGIKEETEKCRLQIFFETKVEHDIKRVTALIASDVSDVAIGEIGILPQRRYRHDDPAPIALKHCTRPWFAQVLPEFFAETRIAEHHLELIGRISLDRLKGFVAVKRIGAFKGEIERQRLTGELD